jgi:hypothetical protein
VVFLLPFVPAAVSVTRKKNIIKRDTCTRIAVVAWTCVSYQEDRGAG